MAACEYVELRFYNHLGVRVNVQALDWKNLTFTEELAGDGSLSFNVPLSSGIASYLEDGFVKVAMPLTSGAAPTEVFAAVLQPTAGTIVADGAEAQIDVNIPGLRALLNRGVLFPEKGGWDKDSSDTRLFGWMSIDTSAWYNPADWTAPSSLGLVASALWNNLGGAYKITADTTPAVGDTHLFRSEFTLPAASRVRIYWLGSDVGSLYLNSEKIGEATAGAVTQTIDLPLSAGTHTLAAEFTDTLGDELKFAAIVTTLTSTGTPASIRNRTDTTHWKVHKVTGSKPGWTAGAILGYTLSEAQGAQNIDGLSLLTTDFTNTDDSSSSAWTELQEQAFETGTLTLADMYRQVEELDCDIRIKPDFTMQAFKHQGSSKPNVVLRPGSNLTGLTYQGTPVQATKALVRAQNGWTIATDSTGVAAYGNRYTGITAGTAVSTAQGARLASRLLPDMAKPKYVYTATFEAITGCVPWQDFIPGDTIKCLDRTGALTNMRVLSLGCTTGSDTARPSFVAELKP